MTWFNRFSCLMLCGVTSPSSIRLLEQNQTDQQPRQPNSLAPNTAAQSQTRCCILPSENTNKLRDLRSDRKKNNLLSYGLYLSLSQNGLVNWKYICSAPASSQLLDPKLEQEEVGHSWTALSNLLLSCLPASPYSRGDCPGMMGNNEGNQHCLEQGASRGPGGPLHSKFNR